MSFIDQKNKSRVSWYSSWASWQLSRVSWYSSWVSWQSSWVSWQSILGWWSQPNDQRNLAQQFLIIVRTRWWWSWWRRRDMNEKRYGRGSQLHGKSATIKVIPQRRSFRGLDCLCQSEAWIQSCWPMRSFHFQRQFCIRTICIGRVICNLQLADAKESELWYIIEWVKGLGLYFSFF